MAYGIEVRNDQGGVQIDGEYQNLSLLKAGGAGVSLGVLGCGSSTNSMGRADGWAHIPHNFNAHPEAVITARPRGSGQIYSMRARPANGRFEICFKSSVNIVDYAIYATQKIVPSYQTDYGFQVLSSSGRVVFDSREKYLKVLGYLDFYLPASDDNVNVVTKSNPYAAYNPYLMQPPAYCKSYAVAAGGLRRYVETWVGFDSNGNVRVENGIDEAISGFRVFLVQPP